MDNHKSRSDSLSIALAKAGITDDKIVSVLGDILDNAVTSTPTGEPITDYKTMLDAIKVYLKMRSDKPDTQINIANIFGGKGGDL